MPKPFYLATALLLLTATELSAQSTSAKSPASRKSKPSATARPVAEQSVAYANRITAAGLRQDLEVLAADAYGGRGTGQPGQRKAADYLAKALAEAGLTGPVAGSDTPYFQQFTLNRISLDPASTVKVGNRTFVLNRDFYVALRNPATGTVQPAFVGYGIRTEGYEDFAANAPDLQGKALVLLLGEPQTPAGRPLLEKNGQPSPYATAGYPEMMARSPALTTLAPRTTFRIAPSPEAFARVRQDYPGLFESPERIVLPGTPAGQGVNLFVVSPEMGAALLGTTPAGLTTYQQAIAKVGKAVASPFTPPSVDLQVREKNEPFTTENVVGYLPGTDKKGEVVVVSAHYDHVGTQNGVVYNGADDDGSGTVSVLAMARAFAQARQQGHAPRRSLLFLATVGEEIGLLGSQYYTSHPLFPLATTVANLHLDMVGRIDSLHQGRGDYLYLIGSNWLSRELHILSEATNQKLQPLALDYKYNTLADPAHLYYRSDHYNFAKYRVPVIYYTSGLHVDYHQPTDDVGQIDFAALTRRSQLIFRTAWAVANQEQRLRTDPEHHSTGFQASAADLDRYVGKYRSAEAQLSINVTRTATGIQAQPDRQYPFALEPVSPDVFKFDQAGVRVEFDAAQPSFTLQQGGRRFVFTKA